MGPDQQGHDEHPTKASKNFSHSVSLPLHYIIETNKLEYMPPLFPCTICRPPFGPVTRLTQTSVGLSDGLHLSLSDPKLLQRILNPFQFNVFIFFLYNFLKIHGLLFFLVRRLCYLYPYLSKYFTQLGSELLAICFHLYNCKTHEGKLFNTNN